MCLNLAELWQSDVTAVDIVSKLIVAMTRCSIVDMIWIFFYHATQSQLKCEICEG